MNRVTSDTTESTIRVVPQTTAPRKPRASEPTVGEQAAFAGSARQLFGPGTASLNSSSRSRRVSSSVSDSTADNRVDNDSDDEDTSDTPRPKRPLEGTVLEHFVPDTELLKGVAGLATGAIASSAIGVGRLVKAVATSAVASEPRDRGVNQPQNSEIPTVVHQVQPAIVHQTHQN